MLQLGDEFLPSHLFLLFLKGTRPEFLPSENAGQMKGLEYKNGDTEAKPGREKWQETRAHSRSREADVFSQPDLPSVGPIK